jgi:hypothetical protein
MQVIDLKQIFYLINENKDTPLNLNLDEGCTLQTEEPQPLIKVLNYCINYLDQLTEHPVDVGLELRGQEYVITMMALTDHSDLPDFSENNIEDALKVYNAKHERLHETGRYVQIKILFDRSASG